LQVRGPAAASIDGRLGTMDAATLALLVACLAVVLAAVAAFARRGRSGPVEMLAVQQTLDHLLAANEALRRDVQQGREAALLGLAGAAQDLQARLAHAQRTLAEVKAIEQARTSQLDRAADSLRRLELVMAGSGTRGAAGENLLARALGQLPPDLLETNAAFAGRVVEYAVRLPGGKLLPIDSKWTSVAEVERLAGGDDVEDADSRRRLREQVARELRQRVKEMARYLDPERTLSLAVLAVPDAVHEAVPEARAEGWREGVLVVPYSLALPFVLCLYRLAVRFAGAPDPRDLSARLGQIADALRRLDDEVESRLSRALVQAANARDALRGEIASARQAAEHIAREPADRETV
jgi:DNA recombination protein RmuC